MLNKLMWEVDKTDEALAGFKADPAAFLRGWEESADQPAPPYPAGGEMTEEERAAVQALDFGAIYAMGAHPFLLWQFARSVCVPDSMSIEELIAAFRAAVEPHGYPDFFT
jgi:hypothetical protein